MSGTTGSIGGSTGAAAASPTAGFEILCDGAGNKFLRRYTLSAGVVAPTDTLLDGTTTYVPSGTPVKCPDKCENLVILCDTTGHFLRKYQCDGTVVNLALDGVTIHTPVGTPTICNDQSILFHPLCDVTPAGSISFLRKFTIAFDGIVTFVDVDLDGSTAYLLVGTPSICKTTYDVVSECFRATIAGTGYSIGDRITQLTIVDLTTTPISVPVVLYYNQVTGLVVTPNLSHLSSCDTELSTLSICYKAITSGTGWAVGDILYFTQVKEYSILSAGVVVDSYYYNAMTGLVVTGLTIGTDIVVCSEDTISYVTLCDDNGEFLRKIISGVSTDVLLDGTTSYTPVGTVGVCKTRLIEVVCRCDDTNADGLPDKSYKALVKLNDDGTTSHLADYENDLITSYTPVAPMACAAVGSNLARVKPYYKILTGAGTWTLNTDSQAPTISVSVGVKTIGNPATPPTLQTAAGTSNLLADSVVSFSAQYPRDIAGLEPPFIVTTFAGDVVLISWTTESA